MDNKSLEGKWFNYFCNMRHKYNMRISAKKPLVISCIGLIFNESDGFTTEEPPRSFGDGIGTKSA